MLRDSDSIYTITVSDVQEVAMREFNRELNQDELHIVWRKIEINWWEAVKDTISNCVESNNKES
jgi:hypothetical protein